MAESIESTGSEFPVFKSEGGAFDRAKFNNDISKGGAVSIPTETIESMKAANSVAKAANIFYNESFNSNVKELDPELDTKSIFYKNAYSDSSADKRWIKGRIDDGEAIDGKEIFEMSKSAAVNKIANAKILKTGKPTEIIENIGYREIKNFEAFDDTREDFNNKVKDENLKFDVLAKKFLDVLSHFNDTSAATKDPKVLSSVLYTPENNAMISALSKILEAEGFDGESVLNMAKKYEDNINSLLEKKENKTIESASQGTTVDKTTEDNIQNLPEQRSAEDKLEEKIEEKREENILPPPIEPAVPVESDNKTITEATSTQVSTTDNETKLEEKSAGVSPLESKPITDDTGNKNSVESAQNEILSLLGVKLPVDINTTENTSKSDISGVSNKSLIESAQDEMLSMLGIKLPGDTNTTESVSKSDISGASNKSSVESAQDEILESLGFTKSTPSSISMNNPKDNTTNIATQKINETKILEKSEILDKDIRNETFSDILPIKETDIQNLSTITNTEPIINTNTGESNTENINKQNNNSPVVNQENVVDKVEKTNNPLAGDIKPMDNNVNEETEKMNREMANNMKIMVNLLSQLNNTLQSPLIVIPNDKKFG